ncbi:AsmA family protein [Kiloniella sp. EL199]|uniref:AsmA family protein n=1 Tax=Kiloniella sp. EL199 TaxID=2107581 RepID=UPI000EA0202D|nr:AsmA family protein [Kiloniella sp. EL199]
MRKFTISISVILLLVVAGVLFGPGFVNWNKYKSDITEQVYAYTGRTMDIEGDLNLRVLPIPSFSATDVRFANDPRSSNEAMVTLDELGVKVAIFPLLSGRLRVDEVILRKPTIHIEKFSDGSGNWVFSSKEIKKEAGNTAEINNSGFSAQESNQSKPESTFFSGVTLDRFRIVDGTIHYDDAERTTHETLEGINVEIAANSLTGPFSLSGDLLLRGQRTEVELDLGRFAEEGATAINTGVRLPDSQAKLKFNGSVSRHVNSISYRGKFEGDGSDLGSLVSELFKVDMKTSAESDFELSAELEGNLNKLAVNDIVVRVGAQKITGGVNVGLKDGVAISMNLASPRVNLDDILAVQDAMQKNQGMTQEDVPRQSTSSTGKTKAESRSEQLPASSWPTFSPDVFLKAQLSVDDIIYNQQIVRGLVMQARLQNGLFELQNLSAQLPSGSQIALAANYQNQTVNGQLNARTEDLRGLLTWLDIDVPDVPNDRLRRLDSKVRFSLKPDQVILNPVSVTLDVTHLDGAATIALRDRPGIGARLVIDRIDLDAYKAGQIADPALPANENTSVSENSSETNNINGKQQEQASERNKAGSILTRADANLDITLGEAVYQGIPFRGVKLDATLQQGRLQIKNASLDDIEGSSLALSGTIKDFETATPAFDTTVIAKVIDLPKLLTLAGQEKVDGLAQLGSVEVSGNIKGTKENLSLDLLGAAMGGSYQAKGVLRPGEISLYQGLVAIDHPDAAQLVRRINPEAATNSKWGRVSVKSMVKADASEIELSELDGTIANTRIQGSVITNLTGTKPKVTANLMTGKLDLSNLLPRPVQGGASGGASGGGSSVSAGLNRRWSQEKFDLAALSSLNADVSLISDAVRSDAISIADVQAKATLQDATLTLSQFSGIAYGGGVTATGTIDGRDQLRIDMDINGQNIDSGALLRDVADFKRVSGPISLQSKVTSEGRSEADLVQGLNGNGQISGVLTAKVKTKEVVGGALLGVLGSKLKGIQGVGDATTTLLQSFAGHPAQLKGTYTIHNGVLVTKDLRVDGNRTSVFTAATVDLPAWLIKSQSDLFREGEDPTKPYLTVHLNGELDKPNPRVKGQFLQSNKSNTINQLLGGEVPSSDVPEPQSEVTGEPAEQTNEPVVEDKKSKKKKAKELLKGLFKELGG